MKAGIFEAAVVIVVTVVFVAGAALFADCVGDRIAPDVVEVVVPADKEEVETIALSTPDSIFVEPTVQERIEALEAQVRQLQSKYNSLGKIEMQKKVAKARKPRMGI